MTTNINHYPANSRYLQIVSDRLGYEFEDLDDGQGYLVRVSNGQKSFLSGGGAICSFPINSATAHGIARDKAHTKKVLSYHQVPTILGRLFFCDDRYAALQPAHQSADHARSYALSIGFPVFCKPNSGARGDFAEIVSDESELKLYIARVSQEYGSFLVEPVIYGEEYRVLIFDGKPIYQLKKTPPQLIGDGEATIQELVNRLNDSTQGYGLSEIRQSAYAHSGYVAEHVLKLGEKLSLKGRQNLSSAGGTTEVSLSVDDSFAEISSRAASALGLRFAAVDLFDTSESAIERQPLIIEVNSNPNMTALEKFGKLEVILEIWSRIAMELLETECLD